MSFVDRAGLVPLLSKFWVTHAQEVLFSPLSVSAHYQYRYWGSTSVVTAQQHNQYYVDEDPMLH